MFKEKRAPACTKRSLRDRVLALSRRFCGDPGEILSKRSLRQTLLNLPCRRSNCMKTLVGGSWEVLVL